MSRLFDVANVIDSDDWYTPAWIFDGLSVTFDMDVAAPDGGAENVPCARFLTVADDGLLTPWEGVVWCNPPYSASSHSAPDCSGLGRASSFASGWSWLRTPPSNTTSGVDAAASAIIRTQR